MLVGVLRLTLHLPDPGSLKSKRHLLRSTIDRLRARFDVAVAEVGDNDLWQRSVVGVAVVGNDAAHLTEVLDKVTDFVAGAHGGQVMILDRRLEIVPFHEHIGEGWRTLADAERQRDGEGEDDDGA